ncbi:DNA-deoxyinosine glycosylase [Paenibacillus abyssi]|uniref:DNA-deoxyinosine glycosylase n=1 Tax=Paenibacillus abyssi TaxID=1340531 RepID=A0A917LDN2_9BACL|nr:DNA-deoxyinosine glycosylase [Paenibacillus abyssi]GGG14928.1 DNA-deoxyinosine glycosylase [Paenibacillus abyssi]
MTTIESFKPVIDEHSTILILGSMPGAESLRRQQYYANPRNHFWPIVYAIYNQSPHTEYEERLNFLLSRRIALWDVLSRCRREGSLDANIQDEEINDFGSLFQRYPKLRAVLFNGTKAERSYRQHVGMNDHKVYARLPSTSPVPGKYNKTLAEKIKDWSIITTL